MEPLQGLVLLISGGDGDSASRRGRMWEEKQPLSDVWRLQKRIQKAQRGARGEWQGVLDPGAAAGSLYVAFETVWAAGSSSPSRRRFVWKVVDTCQQ